MSSHVRAIAHRLIIHPIRVSEPPEAINFTGACHYDIQRDGNKIQPVADRMSLDFMVIGRNCIAVIIKDAGVDDGWGCSYR